MKKKLANDEIDLIDVFQIIWKKKKNVILSVIISLFLAVLIQISTDKFDVKKKIKNMTDIKAIKMVDESKYEVFNSFVKTINPLPFVEDNLFVGSKRTVTADDGIVTKIENLQPKEVIKFTPSSVAIYKIDKKFLLKIFAEEVSERSNLRGLIKKFNFIKEENYPNKIEYENAIDKTLSNIKISNVDSLYNESESHKLMIEYETHDVERWGNFLKFLEQETNRTVQTKLVEMFDNYLTYIRMINNFEIEDLESTLLTVKNDKEKMLMSKRIIDLKSDKYVERIKTIFNSSPISNNEKFYAAKILYNSTVYEETSNSLETLYATAILLGGIFGIFYALISNAIQKRS